jgi:hypothetical protein
VSLTISKLLLVASQSSPSRVKIISLGSFPDCSIASKMFLKANFFSTFFINLKRASSFIEFSIMLDELSVDISSIKKHS